MLAAQAAAGAAFSIIPHAAQTGLAAASTGAVAALDGVAVREPARFAGVTLKRAARGDPAPPGSPDARGSPVIAAAYSEKHRPHCRIASANA